MLTLLISATAIAFALIVNGNIVKTYNDVLTYNAVKDEIEVKLNKVDHYNLYGTIIRTEYYPVKMTNVLDK